MKKIILFFATYLLGLVPIILINDYVVYYFIVCLFSFSIFYNIEKEVIKNYMIHPLCLSLFSTFFIFIVHGYKIVDEIYFILPLIYLVLMYNFKNVDNSNDGLILIEYILLPIMVPLSLSFIINLIFRENEISIYLYIGLVIVFYSHLMKIKLTNIYLMINIIIFNSVSYYVYNFIKFINLNEYIVFIIAINLIIIKEIFKNFKTKRGSNNGIERVHAE